MKHTNLHSSQFVGIEFVRRRGVVVKHQELTCEDVAEVMRKKERYRQLIFSRRLVLPHRRAAELLGPDCLYQLYSLHESGPSRSAGGKSNSRSGKRAAGPRLRST